MMMRMSPLKRTDQKCGSRERSMRWNFNPGAAGSICRSNAVVLAAFCSAAARRASAAVKVAAIRNSAVIIPRSYREDLHNFVPKVIYDLNSDSSRCGARERAGDITIERRPSFLVDFGAQCRLE